MDTKKKAAAAAPQPSRVAYHQGPPEVHFAGRVWRQGDSQPVTDAEWAAMQKRADFGHFDFKPTPQASPAADFSKE